MRPGRGAVGAGYAHGHGVGALHGGDGHRWSSAGNAGHGLGVVAAGHCGGRGAPASSVLPLGVDRREGERSRDAQRAPLSGRRKVKVAAAAGVAAAPAALNKEVAGVEAVVVGLGHAVDACSSRRAHSLGR